MKSLTSTGILLAAICFFLAIRSCAQSAPLPLGTVTNQGSVVCSGFQRGATCEQLTINCANVAPVTVIVGTVGSGYPVFLMNGSTWLTPGMSQDAAVYVAAGYKVIEAYFAGSAWQLAGTGYTGNILNAACRPATLISYVANGSPIAAEAGSAGAGALAYAMEWYGLAPIITVAEFISGPVFADIEQGCESPRAANVTIYPTNGTSWSDQPWYSAGIPSSMSLYTGYTCQPKGSSSSTTDQAWLAESVNAAGGANYFPETHIAMWLCETAQTQNNSAAQSYLWISQVTSPWQLTAMNGCSGDENPDTALTPQGETGLLAITGDLEAQVAP